MSNSAPVRPVRRKRRWFIRISVAVVLLAVLAFGIGAFVSFLADADLTDIYARLDRDDPNWRLEDLEAHRREVPLEDNSALQAKVVTAALGRQRVGSQFLIFAKLFDNLPPQAQLNIQQLNFLKERMQTLNKAVVEASKLKDMPHGRFPITYTPDYYSTSIRDQQDLWQVLDLLQWDAAVRVHVRDADGAIDSCRALLNGSRALGDEPFVYSMLNRYTGHRILTEALERVLAQGQPSDAALKELQVSLAIEINEPTLRNALRGQLAGYHHLMTSIESGKTPASVLNTLVVQPPKVNLLGMVPGRLKKEHGEMLQLLVEMVAAAELPLYEHEAAFNAFEAKLKPDQSQSAQILGAHRHVAFTFRRTQAQLRCAMVALAAERYRVAHKDWPKTLHDLVAAKLLDLVPGDPFVDAPLRLKHLSGGIVIYSVGVDRIDNGGYIDREQSDAHGIDIGFRLWNVSARRQAPMPTVTIDAGDYR
ncbi:MAG: hypothetical protein HY040_20360 [Planctomycetes bacterium]|nr:hypothetical protein [Planctomycetota bacterium]